jgi:hypothetical protein
LGISVENGNNITFNVLNSTAPTEKMRITTAGNVGIGTTTPSSKLYVYQGASGATPSLGPVNIESNTNAYISLLTPNTAESGLVFGDPESYAVGSLVYNHATDKLNINVGGANPVTITSGNVGIGTTAPTQKLHVVGNCVTGDTLLRIRRRKKKSRSGGMTGGKPDPDDDMVTGLPRPRLEVGARNDETAMTEEAEWDHLLCRIDEILPGDEVLSLNESTEALEYSKINKLMDMGIKEVYELTTKSGRTIRTTAAHPYLTLMTT